jgi:hypothetical protein
MVTNIIFFLVVQSAFEKGVFLFGMRSGFELFVFERLYVCLRTGQKLVTKLQ